MTYLNAYTKCRPALPSTLSVSLCTSQILVSKSTQELWLYLLHRRYYPSPILHLEYPIELLPKDGQSTELGLPGGRRDSVNWTVMPMFLVGAFDVSETGKDEIKKRIAIDVGDVCDARAVGSWEDIRHSILDLRLAKESVSVTVIFWLRTYFNATAMIL